MTESCSLLHHRPFRLLFLGRTTIMLGNAVAPIALAFAVLDLTGSVALLGLVVGVRSLTNVVFILFGGVLADRMPRRTILVVSSYCSALTQLAVAALAMTRTESLPLLLVLSAANGTASAFAFPAASALTPQTVPPQRIRSAVVLIRLGSNTAMMAGASAGGLLVAVTSPGFGLAVDATTFALAGCCFSRIRQSAPAGTGGAEPAVLTELRQGWREFTARTWVWVVVAGFCFVNAAFVAGSQILGPVIADHTIGRRAWGLVLACQTAGMLFGALVSLVLRIRRQLLLGVGGVAATALFPLALALHPTTPILCGTAFSAGVVLEQFTVTWETSLQQHIHPARLARVYSYDALGSYAAIPLAQIAVGPLAQAAGPRATLLAAAATLLTATVLMVASRSVRDLRATHTAPSAKRGPRDHPSGSGQRSVDRPPDPFAGHEGERRSDASSPISTTAGEGSFSGRCRASSRPPS
ncbi:MFS transporter [Streptomyces sp. NPDC006733]|uniref:MFS transporter n=1 Tax=Streptomyces sp. NPDC006733 TaxID=3155460 RepID=UPI0033D11BDA